MSIDFPLILVGLTVLSGLIWLFDYSFFSLRRAVKNRKEPWWIDYARSFFPVFLIVLIIRSFIFQIYRVPSGSLMPTVVPGDFLLVGQYAYGLRLPVIDTKVLNIGKPKRGDIAVFHYPPKPSIVYIKRVIGVPGDYIEYKKQTLYVNGKEATQKVLGQERYAYETNFLAEVRLENLAGVPHKILVNKAHPEDTASYSFVVPEGYYFMMGDNRDDSADSRFLGVCPRKESDWQSLSCYI